MSTPDTSGPEFSLEGFFHDAPITNDGMTLRDYFAAKAMQGFAASESEASGHWTSSTAADRAYEWADAMLEARAK